MTEIVSLRAKTETELSEMINKYFGMIAGLNAKILNIVSDKRGFIAFIVVETTAQTANLGEINE